MLLRQGILLMVRTQVSNVLVLRQVLPQLEELVSLEKDQQSAEREYQDRNDHRLHALGPPLRIFVVD